jgi:hypothetical protein
MSLICMPATRALIAAKAEEVLPPSEVRLPRKRLTDPVIETGPRVGEPGTLEISDVNEQLEFNFSTNIEQSKD